VAGCYECGDEPSGSSSRELVSYSTAMTVPNWLCALMQA
jgi:hypothetical protein